MIYPNIESYRDFDDVTSYYEPSCLENNCNQIFIKGPVMTKEILHKVNSEIVPGNTSFCGTKLRTRSVIYLTGLSMIFILSTFGTVLLWFTDSMNEFILSQMVIRNDSNKFDLWITPPVKPLYKVYIFNYTNHESYQNGLDTKLKVKELGPYVYQESIEKLNIEYEENTITYQENHSYIFRPDLSKGKETDRLIVPNMQLLAGAALAKNLNYFSRLGLSALFTSLDETPFMELSADSYIMGYSSRLITLSQLAEPFTEIKSHEKVGLMAEKSGVRPQVFTVNIGKDITKYATFEKINGEEQLNLHSTEECNSIAGTDGGVFPPKKVQSKQTVHYYFPEMCRKYPLQFSKEHTILDGRVLAYEYASPDDIYDYEKPENQCYCSPDGKNCPLKGVYNVSKCTAGLPIVTSFPHFRHGDPKLFEYIDGLTPNVSDFKTQLNIHPKMGFVMTGKSLLQLNIQVHKVYPIHQLDFFNDGIILPLAWFNLTLEEKFLTPVYLDLINESTFTVNTIEQFLKYGTLLTSILTILFILLLLVKIFNERKMFDSTRRRSSSAFT